MNLLYNNEIFIENIFKIRNDIFKKLSISETENFSNRKVSFNKNCELILIPTREEYINQDLKYEIWYSLNELQTMRTSYFCEINIISNLKNITFNDALKLWKCENNMIN